MSGLDKVELSLESPAGLAFDAEGKVASELQGTRVLFDGVPAPLLYVSNSQIDAIVSYEVAGKQLTTIRVERNRETNATFGVSLVSSALGIFRVLNQDILRTAKLIQQLVEQSSRSSRLAKGKRSHPE
jgi:uncharacterized protein (TIGR03437 family)